VLAAGGATENLVWIGKNAQTTFKYAFRPSKCSGFILRTLYTGNCILKSHPLKGGKHIGHSKSGNILKKKEERKYEEEIEMKKSKTCAKGLTKATRVCVE
jgi:hypothetical protein